MPSDRSADRHPPGRQVGVSARLDREDYEPFEAAFKNAGINRRQAIIRAIRDWTAKHASPLRDASEAGTANRAISTALETAARETTQAGPGTGETR